MCLETLEKDTGPYTSHANVMTNIILGLTD